MSKLIFIRHAQASFMAKDYDQLSELGILQSKTLGAYLVAKKVKFDKIFVGPLKRHHQTMAEVEKVYKVSNLEWPIPIQIEELVEHQGTEVLNLTLESLLKTDDYIQTQYKALKKAPENKRKYWLRMFTHCMNLYAEGVIKHPEIQPWTDFRNTVKKGINIIMDRVGSGANVAAFTSGGTTAAAMGYVLSMTNESKVMRLNGIVKNTAMTEFLFSGNDINLKTFNETPHIVDEQLLSYV